MQKLQEAYKGKQQRTVQWDALWSPEPQQSMLFFLCMAPVLQPECQLVASVSVSVTVFWNQMP